MAYKEEGRLNEYYRERYASNVEFIKNYKLERGCADCGYNEHFAGLEFDHIKPRLRGTVASQMGKSLRVILEEIERCEVVCGTCHQIRSWKRRQEAA